MRSIQIALLGAVLGAGCMHAPRPFTFTTQAPAAAAVDRVAASLTRQGHAVSAVDRGGATVTTSWEDTGYRYRETPDMEDETNVFLRFHVEVRPAASGSQVVVSAESQRCVPRRPVVMSTDVQQAACVKMSRLITSHQRTVDDLGRTLAAAVAGG
jgi:hypothetical protein